MPHVPNGSLCGRYHVTKLCIFRRSVWISSNVLVPAPQVGVGESLEAISLLHSTSMARLAPPLSLFSAEDMGVVGMQACGGVACKPTAYHGKFSLYVKKLKTGRRMTAVQEEVRIEQEELDTIKRSVLTSSRRLLVESLDPANHLSYLRSKFVLTERDAEEITAPASRSARVEVFLDKLSLKGSEAYDELQNSLCRDRTQLFLLTSMTKTLELLKHKVREFKGMICTHARTHTRTHTHTHTHARTHTHTHTHIWRHHTLKLYAKYAFQKWLLLQCK